MEVRSRVAATAAAVIPFSCVICFDEFTAGERPPMVLPCGHTFVCLPCSKRLRKCMECREPLFLPRTPAPQSTPQRSTTYHRRGRASPPQTPPVPSAPPVPLPIPKNVVLLAMMEAAERQSKILTSTDSLVDQDEEEEEEEEEDQFDLNRIISGMATHSGPTGTYVVRESSGLAIISERTEDDHEEKKQDEPRVLEEGQRVQIVDFDNGVARLARNEGYIKANTSQLVKVGLPLDQSCTLEGLLNTVKSRGQDLQRELDENHKIEENLKAQLQAALEQEPTYPIVSETPKPENLFFPEEETKATPSTPNNKENAISQPVLQTPERRGNSNVYVEGIPGTDSTSPDTGRIGIPAFRPRIPDSPCSIDNADIHEAQLPSYRRSNSNHDIAGMGCGAAFLGETSHLFGGSFLEDGQHEDNQAHAIQRTNSVVEGSLAQHHLAVPTQTSSFDLDFRTGLSGHRALNTSKHRQVPRTNMRLMSEHRGIARIRPMRSPPSPTVDTPPSPGWTDMIPLSWQQMGHE